MSKFTKWVIGIVAAVVIGMVVVAQFVVKIDNGYVGVVYSANGGVQDETLSQGWHVIGFFDKVIEYPIRLQTVEYKDVPSASSDGKNLTIQNISFNYQVEPSKVVHAFKTFGAIPVEQIEESYLRTRLADAVRKSISKYTVIDIYGEKSSDAAADIQKIFSENIAELGFNVSDLTLGVPTPDAKTQEAIDQRVQASQELERKNTELDIAKKEAARKLAESKGIADSQIEEARGESEANKLRQQAITKELIEYETIQKWNGQLPTVQSGSNSGMMIQVPTAK